MTAPRQSAEHAFCVCDVNGFAEDLAPQHDHGVRTDDDHRPIVLVVDELFDGCPRFALGKLLHRFERLFEQAVVERLVGIDRMHAKLQTCFLEQLPAPRRCACEHYIDCFIHLVVFPQTKKGQTFFGYCFFLRMRNDAIGSIRTPFRLALTARLP